MATKTRTHLRIYTQARCVPCNVTFLLSSTVGQLKREGCWRCHYCKGPLQKFGEIRERR